MKIEKKENHGTEWLKVVQDNIETMRFGIVQITVHDSKVVQIEKTEKTRFDTSYSSNKESSKGSEMMRG